MYTLSGIYIYPVKSLSGISLNEALVEKRGLQYDRRWMLIDGNNQFLSQRQFPEMALLDVGIRSSGLKIRNRKDFAQSIMVPFDYDSSEQIDVKIWDWETYVHPVSPEIDQWFSAQIGQKCRLVFQPYEAFRRVDPRYTQNLENPEITDQDRTSLSDGFPSLIIGQAALDELNRKLESPVNMNRFRPNLVFTGGKPHDEDHWNLFSVGEFAKFQAVKPCTRCTITTVDQSSGARGKEPLKTLETYRKFNNKILFGQNLRHHELGQIRVGDEISLL